MSQDQPFIWKSSLGGPVNCVGQSLRISKAGHTVLASLMESQIRHQLVGEVFRMGTMASAHLDSRHLSLPLHATGTPQAAIWHQSPEGVSQSRWAHVYVLQGELLGALAVSSTDSIPTGFCTQKLWGFMFLALELCGGSPGVGLGLLPRYPSQIFNHH